MILWITVAFGSCLSSSLPPLFSLWCMNQLLKYMLFTFYWYQGTKKLLVSHSVFLYISEGSYHIHTSVCDKNIKLWELHYNIIRNDFFNRDTLHSHVSVDVSIFSAAKCFPPNHVKLYTVEIAVQCWSKFRWELWSKMYGSEIQGVKVYDEVITFQRAFLYFFGHALTYIPLERQFNAEQSFLGNHGLKMSMMYIIIFQTDVLIFPNMLIFVP